MIPTVTIPLYRTVPAPTGIGWVTLEKFSEVLGAYRPAGVFRSKEEALSTINPPPTKEG